MRRSRKGAQRPHRDKARNEIGRRFPSYADLIDPEPPPQSRASRTRSARTRFCCPTIWAASAVFCGLSRSKDRSRLRRLRRLPVMSRARFARCDRISKRRHLPLADIPTLPIWPLRTSFTASCFNQWSPSRKPAKNLIVVTNGALGLLPLALLPTGQVEVKEGEGPLFAGYRNVPWLARTHAVTMVPSVAALRTLRQLPPGSDKREPLIGFGDPSATEQAAQAQATQQNVMKVAAAETRGIRIRRRVAPQTRGVDSADLALLPRLPDTADELKAVALALQVDPSKVLNLGKDANEREGEGDRPLALPCHRLRHSRIGPRRLGRTEPAGSRSDRPPSG